MPVVLRVLLSVQVVAENAGDAWSIHRPTELKPGIFAPQLYTNRCGQGHQQQQQRRQAALAAALLHAHTHTHSSSNSCNSCEVCMLHSCGLMGPNDVHCSKVLHRMSSRREMLSCAGAGL